MRERELADLSMRRSTGWVATPRLAAPCFVGDLSSTFHFVSDLSGWRIGDSSRKREIHRERGRELL
jgi:hypothetical protein